MGYLFDISSDFAELFNQFDEIQEMEFENEKERADMLEAWFTTLEGIEEEFNFKAENMAQYIKSMKAQAAAIKEEENKLKQRRQQYDNRIDRMVEYLKNCMERIGVMKIEMPRAKLQIQNNAPSLIVENEIEFIAMLQNDKRDDLLKYELPGIKKDEIKKLMKSGETFPGAHLEKKQRLVIG